MINERLTHEELELLYQAMKTHSEVLAESASEAEVIECCQIVRALRELQERRKFDQAKLINKFYERYPLDTFKGDTERAEALGYYMAGAELQRGGEFIVYEDVYCDE